MKKTQKLTKVRIQINFFASVVELFGQLSSSYNNIGLVYDKMGRYSRWLSFYEKTLDIERTSLPANHPDLDISYGNVGLVCEHMDEHSKALTLLRKAFDIYEK